MKLRIWSRLIRPMPTKKKITPKMTIKTFMKSLRYLWVFKPRPTFSKMISVGLLAFSNFNRNEPN